MEEKGASDPSYDGAYRSVVRCTADRDMLPSIVATGVDMGFALLMGRHGEEVVVARKPASAVASLLLSRAPGVVI